MNRYINVQLVFFLLLCFGIRGGEVLAQGILYVGQGASLTSTNAGTITLNNTKLTNQGTIISPDGLLYFIGNASKTNVKYEGAGYTQLDDLIIDKTSNDFALHNGFYVNNQVSLTSGGIELVAGNIELDSTGILSNEINTRRIYGTGGEIIRKIIISAPNAENPANLGAVITTNAKLGNTIIARGHKSFNVNGNNSALRYYRITPVNNSGLNATLRFNYFDEELNGINEFDMQIWYSENKGITWIQSRASQRNTTSNFIEINKIDKFAWYTIAPPCKPLLTNLIKYVSQDSSYFFKGQYLNTTGIYEDKLVTAIGCDSFVTLNLFMKPMITLPIRDTIVRGIGYFTLNGKVYNNNQIVRDTIRGAHYDSIRVYNVIINIPKIIPSTVVECQNVYTWRGKKYTQNGTYRDTVLQRFTDTIYEMNLTLNNISLSVSYINGEFVSNCSTCTSFQWYLCNPDGTKSIIHNATSRTMKTITEGEFSVEVVGVGGCTGFSPCVSRLTAQSGIASNTDIKMTVYPNPFQDQFYISLEKPYAELEITLVDMSGKLIFGKTVHRVQKIELDMQTYPKGNYLLMLKTKEDEKATIKVTKE